MSYLSYESRAEKFMTNLCYKTGLLGGVIVSVIEKKLTLNELRIILSMSEQLESLEAVDYTMHAIENMIFYVKESSVPDKELVAGYIETMILAGKAHLFFG